MSKREVYNIVVAVLVTALIFAYNPFNPMLTFENYPKAFIASAIAFALTLPAQKYLAKRLQVSAFYKLWLPGLILSMLLILIGIKVVFVGGLMLAPFYFGRFGYKGRHLTITEIGLIGVVGPLINISTAAIFKHLGAITSASPPLSIFTYIGTISGMIALYNLVPVEPLDGAKVFLWEWVYWAILVLFVILVLTPSGLLSYLASF
jgi:Zn-dependent protease